MTEEFKTFGRIGVYSFGGPAAQIALMHSVLVEEKKWLTEQQFLNALSFCMLLPGPEAMQLATYAGWRRNGISGGLTAGGLFVLPGAIFMLVLATIYVWFGSVPLVEAIFFGVQATVVAIVFEALMKVSNKALKRRSDWVVAGLSFLAIFALALPFPLIIAGAAVWGFFSSQKAPEKAHNFPAVPFESTLKTIAIWGAVWVAPIGVLATFNAGLLVEIALFFSRLAVVTFGGAYAVLAYMTQVVVSEFGWISTPEMMDGLGLAETTPGPLILVTEFVGFLAGYNSGGLGLAYLAAAVTLWVTFAPCFLWIFVGSPYVERLIHMPRLSGSLQAITAAVVGVILNLSVWFAIHVVFRSVNTASFGPFNLVAPDWISLDIPALLISGIATMLLIVANIGIGRTLIIGAGLGVFAMSFSA